MAHCERRLRGAHLAGRADWTLAAGHGGQGGTLQPADIVQAPGTCRRPQRSHNSPQQQASNAPADSKWPAQGCCSLHCSDGSIALHTPECDGLHRQCKQDRRHLPGPRAYAPVGGGGSPTSAKMGVLRALDAYKSPDAYLQRGERWLKYVRSAWLRLDAHVLDGSGDWALAGPTVTEAQRCKSSGSSREREAHGV